MKQVDTGFDLAMTDRLLTTTRSARRRLDLSRDVDREVLDDCMKVALQAATGGNLQRWRWVIVSWSCRQRLCSKLAHPPRFIITPRTCLWRSSLAAPV